MIEAKEPLALESLAPLEEKNEGRELEKVGYWNQLLTGDLSAVPDSVRQKAGAADESLPSAEREYRLASSINRSWVVDYRNKSREEVSRTWPELRRGMAEELGVADSESEVYHALSLKHQDMPLREQVRRLFHDNYTEALKGHDAELPEDEQEQDICRIARTYAQQTREEYLPLAEAVSQGWAALKAEETKAFALPELISGMPRLAEAVDTLAGMEPEERAKVYEIARSLDSTRALETKPQNLGQAMLHSVRRGVADLRHSLLQGAGHVTTALTKAAAESLDNDSLRSGAEVMDKCLQALHELRRVAQGEVFPINLGEESHFIEELAVDAAGAVPGAALAFMGGAGFGALALAGSGAAVAEARKRSPKGRQELQTAAGILGGAIQAGIYMGMSRIGTQMLNKSINEFLKTGKSGVKRYSLAALKSLGALTAENAKLLLAGKAAQATELGMQELAAQVDNVASHIDWASFGNNLLDIETNMREAAMNLPYVLIAAGRAALHHFRSPDSLVENRALLEDWGVDEAAQRHILAQPDMNARTEALRKALTSSTRWGGAGMLERCIKALCLLNTDVHTGFKDAQTVRHFLKLPSEVDSLPQKVSPPRDLSTPEARRHVNELMNGKKTEMSNVRQSIPYIRIWDEWNQKARGEWIREPENFKARSMLYLNQRGEKGATLPPTVRLDGYYAPYREELARVVMRDQFQELINLSYQYLMNRESPDSLRSAYRSEKVAREKSESTRRELLSLLMSAMDEGMRSGDWESAMDSFSATLEHKYETRRRVSVHLPAWMRRVKAADFQDGYRKSLTQVLRNKKSQPRELIEAYRIMLGLRSCAGVIMDVMPHTGDFQELLTMGYSPEAAFAHLLHREMKEHINPDIWNPPALTSKQRNDVDNMRRYNHNKNLFARYEALSGNHLESSPDGSGKVLWRAKRPDGRYTPWLPTVGLVVNSVAGNVRSKFLPMGKNLLVDNVRKAYRNTGLGKGYFLMSFLYPFDKRSFSGFEHMASTASRDLCSRWLGDATQYTMGLEFVSSSKKWLKHKGTKLETDVKQMLGSPDAYLVKQRRMETPLSLARLRFLIYWHRMLSSDWVEPGQVAQALLDSGSVTQDELRSIMSAGESKKLNLNRMPIESRRHMLRKYPGGVVPGDTAAVKSELARRMAELNVLYMLSDLPSSQLPDSVREWYLTCPFTTYGKENDDLIRTRLVRRSNRAAAEEVKSLIPRVKRLRDLEKPLVLAEMMQDAYKPRASRRYEQGWCFAIGGNSAFRSTGQSFWNLLENPERGWKLLTPEDRESIRKDILDVCRGREPEQALQELSEVLQDYPELRVYSADVRRGGQLQRMVLEPVKTTDITEPVYTVWENSLVFRPVTMNRGFTVEVAKDLPEPWRTDARVLPALQLLTELRRAVAGAPYADEEGIWWEQERYGGVDGKRPNGVDHHWSAEAGLASFMKFYKRAAELGDAYGAHGKLNVCGVPLGGIHESDIDTRALNLVTVYRNPRQPEHMVRLMPGNPNALNPYQRKPYVVHTADGIPLFPRRMARSVMDATLAMTPLNVFYSDLGRAYDFDANHHLRRMQIEACLDNLLEKRTSLPSVWESGDARRVNNVELFMQIFQDSRLSYFLEDKEPSVLTRGEALAAELGRLILLAEFGTDREKNVAELVTFCRKLNADWEDRDLLKQTLSRMVSPDPNKYNESELPRPEEDRELDLSPEDAEYY